MDAQENLDDLVSFIKKNAVVPMIVLYGATDATGTNLNFCLTKAYENATPQLQKDAVAALGKVYEQLSAN